MDAELIRMYADEVVWLTARLNRRTADMDAARPESPEFRKLFSLPTFSRRRSRQHWGNSGPALHNLSDLSRIGV